MPCPGPVDALLELSRTLSHSAALDDVASEVARCCRALTGASSVDLFEPPAEGAPPRSLGGSDAAVVDASAAQRVMAEGRAIVVEDGEGSTALLPLVARGWPVGVMQVRRSHPFGPAGDELELLRSLADVAACAIAGALTQAELRTARWQHKTLMEDMPIGTYINSLDGHMTYISPQIVPVLGYSVEEWLADGGKLGPSIWHPDDRERIREESARCQRDGLMFNEEFRMIARDGRVVWILDKTVQVTDPDGRPLYRQGFLLDITERKEAEERLAHLAYHDALTGLPNRTMFSEHLELVLARAERSGGCAAVLLIDLDGFKLVNDSFGHSAGDELLRRVADRLRSATRAGDLVARQSGDEFIVLVTDLDGDQARPEPARTASEVVAEKVRAALQEPLMLEETEIQVSASIGISIYPLDAHDAEGMLKHCDLAMYRVKESGRDGFQVYASDGSDRRRQLSVAGRLRGALDRGEMVLHYQPLIELEARHIVGVEALVRWQDPARGLVPPAEFIPLAERTGAIGPLSGWVIEEACRQSAEWRAGGLDLYTSVNMPPALWKPAAMRHVLDTIEAFGLSPDRLMIEITESAALADEQQVPPILAHLHRRGLRLAIDDFGTGHSSLSRLNEMLVTTLKIDRSFVGQLPEDESCAVLVTAIVQLARNLGLQPLAEGIETEAQRRFLLDAGCRFGQGFLFSKAVPAAEIPGLVRGHGDSRRAAA